jgi:signal transduction histidine kinase
MGSSSIREAIPWFDSLRSMDRNKALLAHVQPPDSDDEYQLAISAVLRAIADSRHEWRPIFDTILEKAVRLCQANWAGLGLVDGSGYRNVAIYPNADPGLSPLVAEDDVRPIDPRSLLARVTNSRSPLHVADMRTDEAFLCRVPAAVDIVETVGARTGLMVPMLKDDEFIGAIGLFRPEVRPFSDREIRLVADFAAQATIVFESARRERQYRDLQSELARANRIAVVGQLTATIAHELSQPLTSILTNGQAGLRWLECDPANFDEVRGSLERSVHGARHATEIIGRVRDLATKRAPRKEPLDLNEAIREVLDLTHGEVRRNRVTISTDLAPSLPRVKGDRVQLQQVIMNGLANAIQAMDGSIDDPFELHITTEAVEPPGVCVGIRDSGPGLSPQILQRLFDPFYTTKPDGMGMGLAISRSIVEDHRGRLQVTNCEPHGALFQFIIPMD